jgi:tetratricopeptide (TPR) repeat protein
MIRLSMLFLVALILAANAEQAPKYDYSLVMPLGLCNRFEKDRVPTAQDVAVIIQACGEALASSDVAWARTRAVVIADRASSYKAIGEYNRAISDLSQAIKFLFLYMHEIEILPIWPKGFTRQEEFDGGIRDARKLLVGVFSDRNDVYRTKQEYDQAIAWWSKLLRLNPEDIPAFNKLALVYGHDEKYYDRAIANATRFIGVWISMENAPALPDMFYQRANAYSIKGKHDLAIADYGEAIRANPSYHLTFTNRGLVYARHKQDYDRAIADFDEAIRRRPRNAYALTCRGLAYKAKGAADLANADLEAAERINPDVKKIAEQQWQLMARLQSP